MALREQTLLASRPNGKMVQKPASRQLHHGLQRARFFEEMRRSFDNLDPTLAAHGAKRSLVEGEYLAVETADDQEGRRFHPCQCLGRQIGTPAARDNSADGRAEVRRGDERSRRSGAGAEISQGKRPARRVRLCPGGRRNKPLGKEIDVEDIRAIMGLALAQEVEEQGCKTRSPKSGGNVVVARTQAAAAAAMREKYQGTRPPQPGCPACLPSREGR